MLRPGRAISTAPPATRRRVLALIRSTVGVDCLATQTELKPAASELPPGPTLMRERGPPASPVSALRRAIAPSWKLIAQTWPSAIVSALGRVRMPVIGGSATARLAPSGSATVAVLAPSSPSSPPPVSSASAAAIATSATTPAISAVRRPPPAGGVQRVAGRRAVGGAPPPPSAGDRRVSPSGSAATGAAAPRRAVGAVSSVAGAARPRPT